jgi:two-component system, OmpR family, phosphate regulon response regulator PhoB
MRSGPRLKVLVVDDEAAILLSTAYLLETFGHEVVRTADPRQVLDLVRAFRPDVVLQDVRMPGLDLSGLVRSLRAEPGLARTPIVLFSASMNLDEVREEVQADAVLEKPFQPAELLRTLDDVVTAARAVPA